MSLEPNVVHHLDCFDLMARLPDASVDAIITDMPYGTTACSWDTVVDLPTWWAAVKRVLKPRGAFVTTASQPFTSALVMSNPAWFRYAWVWEKAKGANFSSTAYQPLKITEDVLVFSSGSCTFDPTGNNIRYYPQKTPLARPYKRDFRNNKRNSVSAPLRNAKIDVIEYTEASPVNIVYAATDGDGRVHPTQKPVALYEYLLRTYTQPGEVVLDPFCGGGTTAIAALNTGRQFIVGDMTAEYVEIARRRVANWKREGDIEVAEGVKQLGLFA